MSLSQLLWSHHIDIHAKLIFRKLYDLIVLASSKLHTLDRVITNKGKIVTPYLKTNFGLILYHYQIKMVAEKYYPMA
jgi:hypothetical protein